MRVRRLAGLTAAGIAGLVVAPAIGLAPAAAADPCEKSLEYGATAAADLVKLGLLDFRPVGLGLGPVADVTLVSTKSGMNALTPVNSAAAARLLDAKLFGVPLPPGPLTQTVTQEAPPSNPDPHTAHVFAKNFGLLKIGAGDLSAHATWKSGMACGKEQGQNTDATAEIANVTVLPGLGKDSGLVRTSLLSSATQTGLAKEGDQVFSVARASVGVAEISLFAGSRSAIKIEVIKPPTLAVGTAGTKASGSVDYTAPILKITGPGGISHQINSPGDTITLGIPSSLPLLGQAKELAKAEGLPLLGDVPLDGLLGDLNKPDATAKADKGPVSLPGLPALPDVPDLPPAADIIGAAPESLPVVGSGALSLLRSDHRRCRVGDHRPGGTGGGGFAAPRGARRSREEDQECHRRRPRPAERGSRRPRARGAGAAGRPAAVRWWRWAARDGCERRGHRRGGHRPARRWWRDADRRPASPDQRPRLTSSRNLPPRRGSGAGTLGSCRPPVRLCGRSRRTFVLIPLARSGESIRCRTTIVVPRR